MKILINTPDTGILGGVANHYKGLRPYWSEDVHYNFIAGRKGIPGFVLLPFDLIAFFFRMLSGGYDVVLLNPSLGRTALKRDALFLLIASWFDVKKLVFFHGWEDDLANEITALPRWFVRNFDKADAFLVLADTFRLKMQEWGITKPVYLTTTKVDDSLIKDFDVRNKRFSGTLLFLARVEESKGVFVALDTLRNLQDKFPELRLVVAGDGGALKSAKEYAVYNDIENVEFLGSISGDELVNTFMNADIYLLPTWQGEGMPTSILEAMAFGLPVISRPVGGTVSFFDNNKMGALIESKSAEDFSNKVDELLSDKELLSRISIYNHEFAKRRFLASKVASSLEDIFREVASAGV